MPDMLVRLYDLPSPDEYYRRTEAAGVTVRRVEPWDRLRLRTFIEKEFGPWWSVETEIAYSHQPITAFRGDISAILDRYLGLRLDEIRATTLLQDLLDLAIRHKIRIPKDYALLSKASINVEGMIRRLYPKLDMLEIGMPYARELLMARFNPADASGTLMKSLLKFQTLSEDVPVQLSQILMDLESGKFRVNVHSDDLERIATNVRALGLTLFLGILASGLTVGGLLIFSRDLAAWRGLPALGFGALLLAGMLFGAALTFYVLGGRFKKLSLRRFLSK